VELAADADSLSALLRHDAGSSKGPRSRSNSLSTSTSAGTGDGDGEASGSRALLLQACGAWVLTCSLGDEAARRQQQQSRWRRQRQQLQQLQQQQQGAEASSLLQQPYFFFHNDAATTLRQQQLQPPPASELGGDSDDGDRDAHAALSSPLPTTRHKLGRLLESMLNLEKEVRHTPTTDRAALISFQFNKLTTPVSPPLA
jgi:hypothetical protein